MEQKALRRLRDWLHGDPEWVHRDPFGRFGSGSGSRARPGRMLEGTTEERATMRRVLEEGAEAFTVDLPGGYQTGRVRSKLQSGGREVKISGLILDANGEGVGSFQRKIRYADPLTDAFGDHQPGSFNPDGSTVLDAYHASAILEPPHQARGLLSVLNEASAMWYDSLGVDQVSVVAGSNVGGYTWARHGFDWNPDEVPTGGSVPITLRLARGSLADTGGWKWGIEDPKVADKILADLDVVIADAEKGFPTFTPRDVAMLGYDDARWTETIQGREVPMWPGKSIMLGSHWGGIDRNYQENSARASQIALAKSQPDPEGFSYDPVTGRHPTAGYMVSIRGLSKRFPFEKGGDRDALARTVSDYIDAHPDVFEDRSVYMGGWFDPSTGEFVLDPSENIMDRAEAERLGRERNQQAIYDVVNREPIDTGGSGDR